MMARLMLVWETPAVAEISAYDIPASIALASASAHADRAAATSASYRAIAASYSSRAVTSARGTDSS